MSILKTTPAVFAVGNTYQIMVPVISPCLMWVKVGGECYYDDSNGILRSDVTTHRMTVPMAELDRAESYTICYRKMIERKPYFSDTGEVEEIDFDFRPVPADNIIAYHIADAHNSVDGPVAAAKKYIDSDDTGRLDLLILNGDIPNDSGDIRNFDNIYKIIEGITRGEIPTVFSRGNHDTRGIFAEKIADHTPTDSGRSYFTFRLGGLWGIVLDCGEDKADSHPEYGNTVCCHNFRQRQIKFLEKVIESGEYNADDITHKIVISHVPFYRAFPEPFNIETEIYTEWCKLIGENIRPEIMIHGHEHFLAFDRPGDEADVCGLYCPGVIASVPDSETEFFIGGGFKFVNEGGVDIVFNDAHKVHERRGIRFE